MLKIYENRVLLREIFSYRVHRRLQRLPENLCTSGALILFLYTGKYVFKTAISRSDENGDRELLRGNEKASGSWTTRETGKRVGKGSDYTGGWKRGSDPRVAGSSGLVTYLPTYERLKAFHSRLYFRPVNRVPLPLSYVRNSRDCCVPSKKTRSPFSLSLWKLYTDFSTQRESTGACMYERTSFMRGIQEYSRWRNNRN